MEQFYHHFSSDVYFQSNYIMVWSSILVHKLPAALLLLLTQIEDKVTCVQMLRMCVNHLSYNQKLTCCLHIPSFFSFSHRSLECTQSQGTPTVTYHFDSKNNSKSGEAWLEATCCQPWAELSGLSHSLVCYLQIWKGSERSPQLLVILYMVTHCRWGIQDYSLNY